jgi:mRNA interferase RelE/StbE
MYQIELQPKVKQSLASLDKQIAQLIVNKLKWLAQNAELLLHVRLSGEFAAFCKLKIGDYRVLYVINHASRTIVIFKIGHRREMARSVISVIPYPGYGSPIILMRAIDHHLSGEACGHYCSTDR